MKKTALAFSLLTLAGISAKAAPNARPEPTPAYQAAKRAAFLENTQNLPSRGLMVGQRAVAIANKAEQLEETQSTTTQTKKTSHKRRQKL